MNDIGAKVYRLCLNSSACYGGGDDANLEWLHTGAEIVRLEDYEKALKRIAELKKELTDTNVGDIGCGDLLSISGGHQMTDNVKTYTIRGYDITGAIKVVRLSDYEALQEELAASERSRRAFKQQAIGNQMCNLCNFMERDNCLERFETAEKELKAAQEELAACNQAGIKLYADNKAAQERIAELEKCNE